MVQLKANPTKTCPHGCRIKRSHQTCLRGKQAERPSELIKRKSNNNKDSRNSKNKDKNNKDKNNKGKNNKDKNNKGKNNKG